MLVKNKKWGVPIRRYYFECQRCPGLLEMVIPTAYFGCYQLKEPHRFFFIESGQTLLTDLSWAEERLFSNFSQTTRNEIRRFERGSEYVLNDSTDLTSFIPVYNRFAHQRGLSLFSEEEARAYGQDNFIIFSMDRNGQAEILDLYLVDQERKCVTAFLFCSVIDEVTDTTQRRQLSMARRSLLWFAIQYFKREGFEIYDWGGYGPDDPNPVIRSISAFKRSFKGQITPIYHYYSPAFWLMDKGRSFIKGGLFKKAEMSK